MVNLRKRRYNLRERYGIDNTDAQMIIQGGNCYLCGRRIYDTPRVDHDHDAERLYGMIVIKGLAHNSCNAWRERREQKRRNFKLEVNDAVLKLKKMFGQ